MQYILYLITFVCLSTAQNVELQATYLKLQDLENRLIVSESQVDNLKEELASKELVVAGTVAQVNYSIVIRQDMKLIIFVYYIYMFRAQIVSVCIRKCKR